MRTILIIISRTKIVIPRLTMATVGLVAIWLFALGTTSVYFHTPLEKLTGYRE